LDSDGIPDLVIISTGSELGAAVEAVQELGLEKRIRIVSMPCTERFDKQDESYKQNVLGKKDVIKLAIEASHDDWWRKYVGLEGEIIGMRDFGDSAPGPVLQKHYGFDKENIIEVIKSLI